MLNFMRTHSLILLFGIFQIFFTAPGQTFLISLFVEPIFNSLSISLSLFAGLYSAATLLASLFLNPAGRVIDRFSVRFALLCSTLSFSVGCLVLAGATNMWMVFVGFFLLRLFGQGVFGLIGSTVFTKKFEYNRGKALGVMTLGFPFSELIYPTLALYLLSVFGWRYSFVFFALSTLFFMLPFQSWLVSFTKLDLPGFVDENQKSEKDERSKRVTHLTRSNPYSFTLNECLGDYRFYMIVAASTLSPLVMTGILFHQSSLFAAHGWSIEYAAVGLASYAVFKAIFSVLSGVLVDRHGPWWYFVAQIIFLSLATFLAAMGGGYWVMIAYFSLFGTALGMSTSVLNVIWANLYGVKHMGSIKGFVGTFRNGVTAFGPLPIAIALDYGVSISLIFYGLAFFVFTLSLIPLFIGLKLTKSYS